MKVNWSKRGAKLLAAFFTGYGGGFAAMLPAPTLGIQADIAALFFLPLLSGLVVTWPQLAKIFNEIGGGSNSV